MLERKGFFDNNIINDLILSYPSLCLAAPSLAFSRLAIVNRMSTVSGLWLGAVESYGKIRVAYALIKFVCIYQKGSVMLVSQI